MGSLSHLPGNYLVGLDHPNTTTSMILRAAFWRNRLSSGWATVST